MKEEWFLQKEFAHWLDAQGILYCASAGGMRTNIGTAVKMKMAGYKKGFPDIFIYEPKGQYHGLAIEVKARARSTPEQREWKQALEIRGYKALIMPSSCELFTALQWLKKEVTEYMK